MTKNRKQKEYPRHLIERIAAEQMRVVPEDGELYDNAIRNLYAAFDIAEQYTNRIIVRSTVTFGQADLSRLVDIPTAPVLSVVSIRYYDADDVLQTLDSGDYELVASEHSTTLEFFRIPQLSPRRQRNRVLIEAVCGYSDYEDADTREPLDAGGIVLPGNIEAAVQLRAGTLSEADGDAIIGRTIGALPLTVERLLNPYRMSPYGWQD